jgi:manganese/zinc/iron transport system substrate-binding protein
MYPVMKTVILLGMMALLGLSGCSPAPSSTTAGEGRITVVATTGMIADVVRAIGGERIALTQLMGAGVDPHLYSATEGDVNTLSDAQVIFYNGINLEARLTDIFEQLGRERLVVAVGEAIPAERILQEANGAVDPHVWMDVELWSVVAQRIADSLGAYDEAHAAAYQANAESYRAELAALHSEVRTLIGSIPEGQRVLVTAHDAFQYFSRAYGIEVFAPQGISTASEAGVEDIRRTIDIMVERQVPAIFVESSVPQDIINAIIEGADARGQTVVLGGELFSDAMGAAGTAEGTYIGMIRHNAQVISAALGGTDAGS